MRSYGYSHVRPLEEEPDRGEGCGRVTERGDGPRWVQSRGQGGLADDGSNLSFRHATMSSPRAQIRGKKRQKIDLWSEKETEKQYECREFRACGCMPRVYARVGLRGKKKDAS